MIKQISIVGEITVAIIMLLVGACKSQHYATTTVMPVSDAKSNMVERTLIVMYDETIGSDLLMKAAEEYGANVVNQFSSINGVALLIPEDKNVYDAIKYFKGVKGVISIERNRNVRLL